MGVSSGTGVEGCSLSVTWLALCELKVAMLDLWERVLPAGELLVSLAGLWDVAFEGEEAREWFLDDPFLVAFAFFRRRRRSPALPVRSAYVSSGAGSLGLTLGTAAGAGGSTLGSGAVAGVSSFAGAKLTTLGFNAGVSSTLGSGTS